MARAAALQRQYGIDVGAGRSFFGKPGIPCLSTLQPWGWAIAELLKPIENRTWGVGFTGPLLLHSGKSLERDTPEQRAWFAEHEPQRPVPAREDLPRGVIFAAAMVVIATKDRGLAISKCVDRVRALRYCDTNEGTVYWVLSSVLPLAIPINWRGERQIFRVPSAVVADQLSGRWDYWQHALAAERSCQ